MPRQRQANRRIEDHALLQPMLTQSMQYPALLFHFGAFQPLWQQPGLIQAGPRLTVAVAAAFRFQTLPCKASRRLWPMPACQRGG